jgi:hypothetical protein
MGWIKIAWTAVAQVDGFIPKLRVIARLRRVLKP